MTTVESDLESKRKAACWGSASSWQPRHPVIFQGLVQLQAALCCLTVQAWVAEPDSLSWSD